MVANNTNIIKRRCSKSTNVKQNNNIKTYVN